jgi:hypothetical protein
VVSRHHVDEAAGGAHQEPTNPKEEEYRKYVACHKARREPFSSKEDFDLLNWLHSDLRIWWDQGLMPDKIKPLTLTKDNKARKDTPIFSGMLRYFPLACAAVARLSKAGNDKHNPGEPLHWAREKSTDHGDCIVRHQIEFDQIDPETNEFHATAVAWRAMAQLELLEEQRAKK